MNERLKKLWERKQGKRKDFEQKGWTPKQLKDQMTGETQTFERLEPTYYPTESDLQDKRKGLSKKRPKK